MKDNILVIDTETGGTDASFHSLLTLGAVIVAPDGTPVDAIYIEIAEPLMYATDEALAVNKLNLDDLRANGFSPIKAVETLTNFLKQHGMTERIVLGGHNTAFDYPFLRRLFRGAEQHELFERLFSYRLICTQTAAMFLSRCGKFELPNGSASLKNLCTHFGVKNEGEHNSLSDAFATVDVLNALTKLVA